MKKSIRHLAIVAGWLSLFSAGPAFAAPLQASADGTVSDAATGLVWMRCSVGQTWTGTTCSGDPARHTFDQAIALTGTITFAGKSDWRLPNVRELFSLVNYSLAESRIDVLAFPNTPYQTEYWSSTPTDGDRGSGFAWLANTKGGNNTFAQTVDAVPVRLVRGGVGSNLLNVERPSSDYVDNGNGTVLHVPSNLTWQRCMVGQTWSGNGCSGNYSTMNWNQAKALTSNFAGQSDWRLPTAIELESLVDYNKSPNAINLSFFAQEAEAYLWSSSATEIANEPNYAWNLRTRFGYMYYALKTESSYGVRLVRAAPPVNESDEFFAWAEANYPTLFPTHPTSQTFAKYTYRYYAGTDLVLAVQNKKVYGFGDSVTNRQMIDLTAPVCAANPALAVCKP